MSDLIIYPKWSYDTIISVTLVSNLNVTLTIMLATVVQLCGDNSIGKYVDLLNHKHFCT